MILFVKIMFWLYVVSFVAKVMTVATAEYPRVQKRSMVFGVASTLMSFFIMFFAARVLGWI